MQIRLLGGFRILGAGNGVTLGCRKAQELLGYLLLGGGQIRSRELAIESIWPDTPPDTGRKQIRQALWNIHQSVDLCVDGERLVLAEGDTLALNPGRQWWCDAVEFARTIDDHLARAPDPVHDGELDEALDLYTGALLDGCYSDWCIIERERLETLHLLGLDEAASRAEQRGDRWRAMVWSTTLLRIDPAHERTHRRMMRLHDAAGDRTRALQQFDRCRRILDLELGIRPSAPTIELHEAILEDRSSRFDPVPTRSGSMADPAVGNGTSSVERQLAEIRLQLDALSRSLGS